MVVVYFGIAVGNVTKKESRELIENLAEKGVIDIGEQDWEIDELGYDGKTYFVDYVNEDHGSRSNYICHAASEQSYESGLLTVKFNWYDSNARMRDRVGYANRFDEFVAVLSNLSNLGDEIRMHTDKEIAVGAIEER